MYCLLEVVSVCPEKLAPRFADKIDWIKVSTINMLDIGAHTDIYYFTSETNAR